MQAPFRAEISGTGCTSSLFCTLSNADNSVAAVTSTVCNEPWKCLVCCREFSVRALTEAAGPAFFLPPLHYTAWRLPPDSQSSLHK